MSQLSLTWDGHNERQEVTEENAAQALLLLRAFMYENNDITNEIFPSKPLMHDADKEHEAPTNDALEEENVFKYTSRPQLLAIHILYAFRKWFLINYKIG